MKGIRAGDTASMKQSAVEAALRFVKRGMAIGLGSGTTAAMFIEALAKRCRSGLRITAVPTSKASEELAKRLDIPLSELARHHPLDLTVDGADEIDPSLNLIKGLGGALTREKVVARASRKLVIVADESKLVSVLGERCPVPVEVIPFGWQVTRDYIRSLGGRCTLRRVGREPFITDNGNYILDCRCKRIEDPGALEAQIDCLPGVLENGLFVGLADVAVIGRKDGVEVIRRP